MKRTIISISAAFLISLVSFSSASGQEKKSEQKIKIVIADGSGEKVVIDTVMNDKMSTDTVTIHGGTVYVYSSSNSAGNKTDGDTYSYHMSSDKMQADAEKTKYVITKDGMKITVEGSDYEKVKALVKEIETKLGSDKDKSSKKK
jgi:hypothetical protein